jgi:dTDP-glucose pyrophosphorylase
MKAVIMAAGKGTRLFPLTENIAKPLIPINDKPFLYYLINNLKKAGFDDFAIIVSYKKEQFTEFLDKYGFNATLIEQKEVNGTGGATKLAKEFVNGDNFILLGGDNLFSMYDLKSLNINDNYNYIFGIKSETPEKYGVIKQKSEKLIKIVEKPKEYVGNLINLGLYKFTPEIFEAIDKINLSPRGEYELTDAITILAEQSKVNVLAIKDYWLDLGCLEDIPKIEKFIKENY